MLHLTILNYHLVLLIKGHMSILSCCIGRHWFIPALEEHTKEDVKVKVPVPTLYLVNVSNTLISPVIAVPYNLIGEDDMYPMWWLFVEPRYKWDNIFKMVMKNVQQKAMNRLFDWHVVIGIRLIASVEAILCCDVVHRTYFPSYSTMPILVYWTIFQRSTCHVFPTELRDVFDWTFFQYEAMACILRDLTIWTYFQSHSTA
jgi:hypothetical protein